MLTVSVILIIVSLILTIYSVYVIKRTHKVNEEVDEQNQVLLKQQDDLSKKCKELLDDLSFKRDKLDYFDKQLVTIQEQIKTTEQNQEDLSRKAFENYCEILEKQYKEEEEEYDMYKDAMQTAYSNLQLKLMKDIQAVRDELDQLEATRAAAIQAKLKERQIEENKDNFRLNLSDVDIKDIRLLKSIQKDISNPIVIDKIIWSNYYQPMAKIKFPKIIGKSTACGIYKITNLVTGEPYIGQSNDICDRWKQHCKNALGVGNVGTNKLYKSMKDDGLFNFTFEVLEECERSLLDEKEKYYIQLYHSYDFGLNGNRGNN